MKRLGAPASSPASGHEPTGTSAFPALVPKLRFPVFADDWLEVSIGEFFDLSQKAEKSGTFDIDKVLTVRLHNNGVIKSERATLTGGANYFKRDAGQFIFSKIDLLNGAFGVVPAALDGFASSSDVPAFSFNDQHCPLFFLNWLKANYLRLDIERTGTSSTLKRISPSAFLALKLSTPTKAEQQKIAECLSTLDELIGAASQKLDALKAHKKGLMQQLFPREGETLPRLRFPEFQDAPEWDVRTIGELFRLINGCAFKPEDWKPSGTPIIRIQNLNDPFAEFNYSQAPVPEANRVEPGDLLFAWSGTLGSSFGARIWNGPSGVLNQHIFKVLMDEQKITPRFALLILARVEEDIARRTHGFKASFVHVKKSDLVEVELPLPGLREQHRIASCLSSLDDLIAAQSDQLEALKTHKKGLMQQLFPLPNGVANE